MLLYFKNGIYKIKFRSVKLGERWFYDSNEFNLILTNYFTAIIHFSAFLGLHIVDDFFSNFCILITYLESFKVINQTQKFKKVNNDQDTLTFLRLVDLKSKNENINLYHRKIII